jgi:hypothetical protein
MSTVCCPDCFEPVAVPPHAREGGCEWCRPKRRRHSRPRRPVNSRLAELIQEHR